MFNWALSLHQIPFSATDLYLPTLSPYKPLRKHQHCPTLEMKRLSLIPKVTQFGKAVAGILTQATCLWKLRF